MTVKQLREHLAAFPDDMEVLVHCGDWGPCRTGYAKRAFVFDSGSSTQNWENFYPDIQDENETRPTIEVVLID